MNNVQISGTKELKLYSSKVYMSSKKVSKAYDYFSIKIPLPVI